MKYREGSTLIALRRAQGFLDAHKESFASINTSSVRRNLDDVAARLEAQGGDQNLKIRTSLGLTNQHTKLNRELRLRHMRPIEAVAKLKLRNAPDFTALLAPNKRVGVVALLAAAEGMVQAARVHEQVLIDAGLASNFIARLETAAEAVKATIDGRELTVAARKGLTAGLAAEDRRAKVVLRVLAAQVEPLIGDDEQLRREWMSVKRIDRKAGPPSGSVNVTPSPAPEAPKAA